MNAGVVQETAPVSIPLVFGWSGGALTSLHGQCILSDEEMLEGERL